MHRQEGNAKPAGTPSVHWVIASTLLQGVSKNGKMFPKFQKIRAFNLVTLRCHCQETQLRKFNMDAQVHSSQYTVAQKGGLYVYGLLNVVHS